MAWWIKIVGTELAGLTEHKTKVAALMRLSFAMNVGATRDECGLYKRDPERHPDAQNLLPALVEKTEEQQIARQLRSLMGRRKR